MSGVFPVFAYGSNLHLPQWRARCPSVEPIGPARLDGWRLAFTRASTRWQGRAADVVPDPAAHVWGLLATVSDDDLVALDRSEFLGVGYRRVVVPVGGTAAFAYTVIDKQPEGRPPAAYLAQMVAGARAAGLPADWVAHLEGRWPTPYQPRPSL